MFSSLIAPSLVAKDTFDRVAGQAFNDPFSNIVYLGSQVSRLETLRMFRAGSYPSDCLGAFLHEGTHHLCFDSPTGYALLGIESFSRASWWETLKCRAFKGGRSICAQTPTCFNRAFVRALWQLLTPLAEGLALYGELNALPGQSLGASSLAMNAVSVFCFDSMVRGAASGQGSDKVFVKYGEWVAGRRADPGGSFARTRSILALPEPTPAVEPYTTGYKWINALVDHLHQLCPAARADLDVTLSFFCSFFFNDWLLAAIIARASWSINGEPRKTLQQIAGYLWKRVDVLKSPAVVPMFELYALGLAAGETRRCPFLNYGDALHSELELFTAQAGATELYWQAPKTSRYRGIFRVATMTADTLSLDIENGTFYATVEGLTIEGPGLTDGFPSFDKKPKLEARGLETSIELILVNYKVLACLFYKANLVAVLDRNFRPIDTETAEKHLGELGPFEHAEWWRRHYWELLNPDRETTCGHYLEDRLQEASELGHALYR